MFTGISTEQGTHQVINDNTLLSKTTIKNLLKEYENSPIVIGENFITIKRISDKWVSIDESRNGIIQQDKKIILENAIDYIQYKHSLMLRDKDVENISIQDDDENKSIQYRTQLENYKEVLIDINNIIYNIWKPYSITGLSINIDEVENTIDILVDNKKLTIKRNTVTNELSLHLNYSPTNIFSERDFILQNCTLETSKLIFENSPNANFFRKSLSTVFMMKNQLKILNLVYKSATVEIDDALTEKITDFVMYGKKDDSLVIPYEKFRYGERVFERCFEVTKETKIRTEITVVAHELNDMGERLGENHQIIEYSNSLVKMNKEINNSVQRIASDFVWNR